MKTVAVLPIKRFASAKQRLDVEDRAAVMRDMAARVLAALDGSCVDEVCVVTGDADADALARSHKATVVDEGPLRGHSGAAALGVEHAVAHGATDVVLIAGDCPLMTSEDIDALVRARVGAPCVVVAPDRHGTGTNALLLSPPAVIGPAFGPGSRARHEQLAHDAGAACVIHESAAFAHDVDTVDDLAAVARARAS